MALFSIRFRGRDELSQPARTAARSLEDVERAAEDAGDSLQDMGRDAQAAGGPGGLGGLAAAAQRLGPALAAGAVAKFALDLSSTAREARLLGEAVNVSTGFVLSATQAYKQVGLDITDVRGDLAALRVAQGDVIAGAERQITAFETLGFSIDSVRSADAETLFRQLEDAAIDTSAEFEALSAILGEDAAANFAKLNGIGTDFADSQVESAARAGEAWAEFQTTLENTALLGLADATDYLAQLAAYAEKPIDIFVNVIPGLGGGDDGGFNIGQVLSAGIFGGTGGALYSLYNQLKPTPAQQEVSVGPAGSRFDPGRGLSSTELAYLTAEQRQQYFATGLSSFDAIRLGYGAGAGAVVDPRARFDDLSVRGGVDPVEFYQGFQSAPETETTGFVRDLGPQAERAGNRLAILQLTDAFDASIMNLDFEQAKRDNLALLAESTSQALLAETAEEQELAIYRAQQSFDAGQAAITAAVAGLEASAENEWLKMVGELEDIEEELEKIEKNTQDVAASALERVIGQFDDPDDPNDPASLFFRTVENINDALDISLANTALNTDPEARQASQERAFAGAQELVADAARTALEALGIDPDSSIPGGIFGSGPNAPNLAADIITDFSVATTKFATAVQTPLRGVAEMNLTVEVGSAAIIRQMIELQQQGALDVS